MVQVTIRKNSLGDCKIKGSVNPVPFFFPIMILNCISFKRAGRLCVVNGNGNSEKYVTISEVFLIRSLEDEFGDSEVIFMDDNSSRHSCWTMKDIPSENNVL